MYIWVYVCVYLLSYFLIALYISQLPYLHILCVLDFIFKNFVDLI